MAQNEKRTLSIVARLIDALSGPLKGIGTNVVAFGKIGTAAFKSVASALLSTRGAITGLIGAYAGLRAVEAVRSISEQTEALNRLAEATGDTVENISELQAAFELNGVKADQFAGVIRALGKAQREALGDVGSEAAQNFADIGVSIRDLQTLGPSQLFEKIAEGLAKLNTEQDRATALGKILPKQWLDVSQTVGHGVEAFRQQILEVRKAGATVTGEQARAADSLNDSFDLLHISIQNVGRELIRAFGPEVSATLRRVSAALVENRDAIVNVAKVLATTFVKAIGLATDALIGFVSFIESFPGVKLVDTPALDEQISELQERLRVMRQEFKHNGLFGTDEARAALRPLVDELNQLTADRGLSGQLKKLRREIVGEITAAADDIRTTNAGKQAKSPDEAARQFGIPEIDTWKEYAREFGKAMAAIEKSKASVFQTTPTKKPIDDDVEATRREGKDNEREQQALATQRNLAQLRESTKAVRLEIIELDRATQLLDLKEKARKGIISLDEYKRSVEDVNKSFDRLRTQEEGGIGVGFSKAIARMKGEAEDFATTIGESFGTLAVSAVDGFSDAFADVITGTKSAKEALKDYARQFLADVARMIAKLVVLGTIKTLFGLETGGVVPGGVEDTMPVRGFARGGIARRPTLAVFGEGKNAEAFVPLPDNRSIPVTMNGPAGGNVVNVTIVAWDSKDVTRTLIEQRGLLNGITQDGMQRQHGFRQIVRRSAG